MPAVTLDAILAPFPRIAAHPARDSAGVETFDLITPSPNLEPLIVQLRDSESLVEKRPSLAEISPELDDADDKELDPIDDFILTHDALSIRRGSCSAQKRNMSSLSPAHATPTVAA
jgi:hypothetical protein